jgi:hypothetical protein
MESLSNAACSGRAAGPNGLGPGPPTAISAALRATLAIQAKSTVPMPWGSAACMGAMVLVMKCMCIYISKAESRVPMPWDSAACMGAMVLVMKYTCIYI